MDDPRPLLFDPAATRQLVLARRPNTGARSASAVEAVVSDLVWSDVVRLLRWAQVSSDDPGIEAGAWWRLATGCADLLRLLPRLSDELAEPWYAHGPRDDESGLSGTERIERAAARLTHLLHGAEPVLLPRLAAEVDALGAAAVTALAERASGALP